MINKIKHTWNSVPETYGKTQQFECEHCHCVKGFSFSFGKLIYTDRFGRTHFQAPRCVLPNTLI